MIRENVVGDTPHIDTTAYVDPSAIIIGKVTVGPNCYIGPSVVIRADRFSTDDTIAGIEIKKNCGIQDLAVLHTHAESAIIVGEDTIINHSAVIHGTASIGRNCFIGCKAVLNHTKIGDNVFVRINSIIEEADIPSDRFIDIGTIITAQDIIGTLRPITDLEKKFIARAVQEIKEYPFRYKYSLDR